MPASKMLVVTLIAAVMVNAVIQPCPACIFSGMKTYLTSHCEGSEITLVKDVLVDELRRHWTDAMVTAVGPWDDVEAMLSTAGDASFSQAGENGLHGRKVAVNNCVACLDHAMNYLVNKLQCGNCSANQIDGTEAISGVASQISGMKPQDTEFLCFMATGRLVKTGQLTC